VYCADIGSVASGRFGWAKLRPGGSEEVCYGTESITDLVEAVAADIGQDNAVAIGFECPLFVPVPGDPNRLTSARRGEGSRPWCAGAGAGALATGLTEVVWILKEVRARLTHYPNAHLAWEPFVAADRGLFLWEAFVSGASKAATHIGDAEIAVRAFLRSLPDPWSANAIQPDEVHSLIGAALLRTEWTEDLAVLKQPCLVLKA
jgi:hypothetical protein